MNRWIHHWNGLARGRRGIVVALALISAFGAAAVVRATEVADFSVAAQPPSQTVSSGASTSYVVSVTPSGGFTGTVTLTAGALPKGMAASWTVGTTTTSSASVQVSLPAAGPGATATLAIGGGQPSAGTYKPIVTATSGALSHTATLTLVVVNQNAANFSLAVSPSSQTVIRGSSTVSTVSIARANWTGAVSLGPVSGLPAGATATLSPASTTGSSATLTIGVSASTPPGLYTLVLSGTGVLSGSTPSARYAAFTLFIWSQFGVRGDVPSPLYPGAAAQSFTLTISNPNTVSIKVTALSVAIQPQNAPGCEAGWFKLTLPEVPSEGIALAAESSRSFTATARMLESGTSQDACQGKQLKLVYSGSYIG